MTSLRLETPKQLAARVGLTERQVRSLIAGGQLEHVMVGCRVHIPTDAFDLFLEQSRGKKCREETKGPASDGSLNVGAFTSPGQSTAAAASAQQARMIAARLKQPSGNGCKPAGGAAAPVIPLKSS